MMTEIHRVKHRSVNKVNEITNITETTGPSWVTPAYSKAGNMITIPQPADPTKSYTATYDAWNRLVKVVDDSTSNTVAEFERDGRNFEIVEKVYASGALNKTIHRYYSSAWQILEERIDSSTDPAIQNVWGLGYIDDLILRDRDTTGDGTLNERLYALQDAITEKVSGTFVLIFRESTGAKGAFKAELANDLARRRSFQAIKGS